MNGRRKSHVKSELPKCYSSYIKQAETKML